MIRIIIVSDIRLYREALAELLENNDLLCVIGTSQNAEHAIKEITHSTPDVALIDMTMLDSSMVISQITPACPNTKIVALAMTEDEDSILACAKAGISGYVSRDASLQQLINTVCAVNEGELYCPRRIAASLFNKLKSSPSTMENGSKPSAESQDNLKLTLLTNRERQIATLISDGLSNKQIARKLNIEISTVKNHIHNILAKTGAHNRMQMANLFNVSYS